MNNIKRIYRLSYLYKFSVVVFCLLVVSMRHLWGEDSPAWFLSISSFDDIDRELEKPNPPVDAYNSDGFSGLSYAIMNDNRWLLGKLLSYGADPSQPSKDDSNPAKCTHNTPLHWAVQYGQIPDAVAMVKMLIAAGADINARNFNGKTPLHMIMSITDDGQRTALIRTLVLNGTDINSVDAVEGNTITHLMAAMNLMNYMQQSYLPMFGDLINFNALNKPTQFRTGMNPEDFAYFLGFRDMKDFLEDWQKTPRAQKSIDELGLTPLIVAVMRGDLPTVEKLVGAGAKINEQARNEYGNTALHYAVMLGRAPIVTSLLQKGANIAVRNMQGETPVHMFMRTPTVNREAMVKALAPKLTSQILNMQDNNGNNLLSQAVLGNRIDIVTYLLRQLPKIVKNVAFDLNLRNKDKLTPLMIAERWNRQTIAQLLMHP